MTRRLMHHYLDGYGKDGRITRIVDTTELWFVLSANPDGYDHTHADPANRQWRKNLRDNDGDGRIGPGDGVDLNRNFAYKWGYDNEGSSPDPADDLPWQGPHVGARDQGRRRLPEAHRLRVRRQLPLRRPAPAVRRRLAGRHRHPRRRGLKALAGTPENSAVPGYRPQVSSELYTTNGEADGHAANVNGMQMFTPEMSTCATASRVDPNDAWNPADCASVFTFPDDEKLIRAEFAKNVPFALAVAESSAHPDRPVSPVGADAPDFTPKAFATSYARGGSRRSPSPPASRCGARRSNTGSTAAGSTARSSAPGRAARPTAARTTSTSTSTAPRSRAPGPRLRRGPLHRPHPRGPRHRLRPFTYAVAERARGDVLVLADEGGTTAGRHTAAYVRALADNGRKAAVWDVAVQGAPDALGVLSHSTPSSGTPAPSALRGRRARRPLLPQRGRQADQRRGEDRRTHPGRPRRDRRLRPVLPRRLPPGRSGEPVRLRRRGRLRRRTGRSRRGPRQPAGRRRRVHRHLRHPEAEGLPAVREQRLRR